MKYLVIFLSLITSIALAKDGHDQGNGGDVCEARFLEIRNDLKTWINQGGSQGLELAEGISINAYNERMMTQMDAPVSCVSEVLKIGGTDKTCINFSGKITCNASRFLGTSQDEQYMLVHHEYAGLAGLEVNNGSESSYYISNQITAFLENELVKKLAVNPQKKEKRGAEQRFTNEDGSVTLVRPFLVYDEEKKIPFWASTEIKTTDTGRRYQYNSVNGICRYFGFDHAVGGVSYRSEELLKETHAAVLTDRGEISEYGYYFPIGEFNHTMRNYMITEITSTNVPSDKNPNGEDVSDEPSSDKQVNGSREKGNAERRVRNEDGSVTLVKPFFLFKDGKIPYWGWSKSENTISPPITNSMIGICRYFGFTEYVPNSERVEELLDRETYAVTMNKSGKVFTLLYYPRQSSGRQEFMITEITCR